MKGNFVFFLGLFGALLISWAGIVLGSNAQLGSLAPYYDDTDGTSYPQWMPGEAARGQLVYKDLGCAACHTQQVRRPGFGSDQERGWGDRQSVARDYIYQPFPQLGLRRIGPDLGNIGGWKPTAPDADDILHVLYAGGGGMPPYRFLFEERRIGNGAQPDNDALKLVGALEPKAGIEIVPTARAKALAAYLVSMKTTYDYPEAVPVAQPTGEGSKATTPAPAKAPPGVAATTAPANPPGGASAPAKAPAGSAPANIPPAASATPAPAGSQPAAPSAASPSPAAATGVSPTPAPGGAPAPAGNAAAPSPAPAGSPTPAPGTAPQASPTPSGTGGKS